MVLYKEIPDEWFEQQLKKPKSLILIDKKKNSNYFGFAEGSPSNKAVKINKKIGGQCRKKKLEIIRI